jgi:hypothetical protein
MMQENDYWFTEIGSLTRLVYECKAAITKAIDDNIKIKPEYVFCHSGEQEKYSKKYPGYYFVYSTSEELHKSQPEEHQKIRDICDAILSDKDRSGFYKPEKIEFEFLEKNTADLFGMSRED